MLKKQQIAELEQETNYMSEIRLEISEAHRDWENANRFFNYAMGTDQIDYAIHCMVTAEKRYDMLLRLAKRTSNNWPSWRGVIK
ncbi:DUF2508 family protein [Paenibacillus sp. FSL H8-0548]|uniref:DUF2508 family protein n=1 Tax=Paenibacillus sp. FSL H8-0548 TaxID=1920422 RepID=UPI002116F8C0|nr:DUF2508 family protein [Paenibacillus sp. FSL H8-0548]